MGSGAFELRGNRRAAITNAYGNRPQPAARVSKGAGFAASTLGLSRYTRQLGSGCRIYRDSSRRTVALYATSRFLMSHIARQWPVDVALYATATDERTRRNDQRTHGFDERTRLFDERTRAPANEPGTVQPLMKKGFFAAPGASTHRPEPEKPRIAERPRAGLVPLVVIGYNSCIVTPCRRRACLQDRA